MWENISKQNKKKNYVLKHIYIKDFERLVYIIFYVNHYYLNDSRDKYYRHNYYRWLH